MAYLKRNSAGPCAAHNRSDSSVQRDRIFFARLLLGLLLALLVSAMVIALPVHSGFSVRHGRIFPPFWEQRAVFWLPASRASFTMQTVTSGVVATTEVVPTFTGAQRLNTLSVDLTNPNVRLGVVQAHNRLLGPGETLSSMALRSGAVAGINGDFFEIQGSGAPLGLLKINGQLWQSPDASPVLGITASGRLTIGPETFVGSVVSGNASYPLQSINR